MKAKEMCMPFISIRIWLNNRILMRKRSRTTFSTISECLMYERVYQSGKTLRLREKRRGYSYSLKRKMEAAGEDSSNTR